MDFYRINESYHKFLQAYEKEKRNVTKVPNIRYGDYNKFVLGAVMQVNGMNYYAPVSSFDQKQEANILIRVPGDQKEVKGSIRFNYMFPIPDECIERLVIKEIKDKKYQDLLYKEYNFCMDNAEDIQKKAQKIYEKVITNRKQILTDNSCAFRILEDGYQEYMEKYLKKEIQTHEKLKMPDETTYQKESCCSKERPCFHTDALIQESKIRKIEQIVNHPQQNNIGLKRPDI